MGRSKCLIGAVIMMVLAGCATPTAVIPTTQSALPEGQQFAAEPSGFISFCVRFPGQCVATPNGKSVVTLDNQTWLLLNAVNHTVNAAIWPEDDIKHYGRSEYWNIPTDGYGDCDDYAVTKRKDLLAAGLPAQALRLAVVDSPASGRHAVLTVATDRGDFVLDNLADDIRSWRKTDYIWIERQDAVDPMRWVSLFPNLVPQSAEPVGASTKAPGTNVLSELPTSATRIAVAQ